MPATLQPNILFILIDDLGCRDLGCFSSMFYETPYLDGLAAGGMMFANAYASCPVCSPTRASIMSGKYPARVGLTQYIGGMNRGRLQDVPYLHYLPLEEVSLATALREGGYQTWHVGKWHLGDREFWPDRHGFDVNIGGCYSGSPQGPSFYHSPYNIPTLPDGPAGEYLTDRLTDEAIGLLRRRDRDRPFYLNLWHYAVHTPIQAPPNLVEKYRRKAAAMKLDKLNPFVDGEPVPRVFPSHMAHPSVRRRMFQSDPAYAAMMENLDSNVGRLLEALRAEGLERDTVVVFTSDNGGLSTAQGAPTCNLPQAEGKGWNYEGGTRVCQIIRWPATVRPNTVCRVPVTSTDFYPTFLEAAHLPPRPKQHCDGLSLVPLLHGQAALDRPAIYWHYPHYSDQGGRPAASLVSGKWKLIEHMEDGQVELVDLEADPSETRNLATADAAVTQRLLDLLRDWQRNVAAKLPQTNPQWAEYERRLAPTMPNNARE